MNYWRLGLDIGTNSIGWAALQLSAPPEGGAPSPVQLIDMGVRIFSDGREPAGTDSKTGMPKIGESLAVTRRMARGMRRNRDRRLKRVRAFAHRLVEFGLIGQNGIADAGKYKTGIIDHAINPYAARAEAALSPVSKEVLARALLHLCKRRGFLSNRMTDGDDKEASERNAAIEGLADILEARKITLGQYLHERLATGLHVRFRGEEFDTSDDTVAIYPKRSMYADEFFRIRSTQQNRWLTDEQWDELFAIFSFQRPLIPKQPGVCTFEHGRDGRDECLRASRHLPIAHTFRIVQEVNNLRYQSSEGDTPLTHAQRQLICNALEQQKSLSFGKIRTLLGLKGSPPFNLESSSRKNLMGNVSACDMRAACEASGILWDTLNTSVQNNIFQTILDARKIEDILAANQQYGWALPEQLLTTLFRKHYPSSHGHISVRCMEKLIPLMRKGMQYWEAAQTIYGDHTDYSQFSTGEVLDQLPYYGEILRGATSPIRVTPATPEEEQIYGKIPNPTVHVALNQLRKLINALVRRYGHPHSIHLELARELKTAGANYRELLKKIAKNTLNNARLRTMFQECFPDRTPSSLDMVKMRLWEELAKSDVEDSPASMARTDVYTGRTISFCQLFSDEIEIEHILPYGRTYDDSMSNRTVTFREVNRRKGGNRLPYDFAMGDADINPQAMLIRAQRLPRGKRWRFQPDAAEIYESMVTKNMTPAEREHYAVEKSGAFIDRQLVDTQYISRIAARYLIPMVGDPSRVVPVNGHITNLIRGKWQINALKDKGGETERHDHRHHAEDALIVALADRSLIKRIADETRARQLAGEDYRARLRFPECPAWLTDRQILHVADRINISFRQNHNREARLYQETAYGLLDKDDRWRKEGYHAVARRSILSLKESELRQIRDDAVRAAVVDFLSQPQVAALKWENRLALLYKTPLRIGCASKKIRIRRVRILIPNQSITPIPSAPYKGYAPDSFAFCDIWLAPKYNSKKQPTGKWAYIGAYVSYADAIRFQEDEDGLHEMYKPHPAAKKVMRLFKNDMVMLTDAKGNELLHRIAGYSATANKIDIRPHTESGGKQNYKAISVLMDTMRMRKVHVSIDGRIL